MASVRHPRCWVTIGDVRIPCISATVNRTSKRKSDTFNVTLSITEAAKSGFDLAAWCEMEKVDASVIFSTKSGGGDERVMMTGTIDVPDVDPFTMKVRLSGRDKSSSLTQKKRSENFQNQKPKDIAGKIAKDHGLKLSIEDESAFSGKTFKESTNLLALNRPDFSIISDLAAGIGCRWYVDGDTLYFEPKDQDKTPLDVYYYPPGSIAAYAVANCTRLRMSRNMTAARPHKVTVASWHADQRKLYEHTEELSGQGEPIEYRHHHEGRTQAQVTQLAKARLKNHTRHELGVSVTMPADLSVDVNQGMKLRGTGTIYDQPYDLETISFVMGWDEEFTMDLTARGAKQGREQSGGGSGGAPSGTQASGAIQNAPLPPVRPPELGGGGISL